MAKTIYIKIVHKIMPFCNLHSISKKLPDSTQALNIYVIHIKFVQNFINSAKTEPLKFRTLLLKVSFSRPFQLMKINSTESYVFFLARTYRARIQMSFTNTRGIQYSPYVNPCISPYRVLNLTLGTKYKYTNEH